MTAEQVTTVRTTNFFTTFCEWCTEILTDMQGLQTGAPDAELKVTLSDVPCLITFSGGEDPQYPDYVRIVAPADGSPGFVNAVLPIEWTVTA